MAVKEWRMNVDQNILNTFAKAKKWIQDLKLEQIGKDITDLNMISKSFVFWDRQFSTHKMKQLSTIWNDRVKEFF